MTVCLFLSLADTCVKARIGRKAVERLNMSHKETFIVSVEGDMGSLKKPFGSWIKQISKQKKHFNANTNLF